MNFKRSYLFPALTLGLMIGSQALKVPVNASSVAAHTPTPSLVAFTNTQSLGNLMTEYRKVVAELKQLDREVKIATDLFNRSSAELDRLGPSLATASPEAKAKIMARINQLVPERAQQKSRMDIAMGMKENAVKRLAGINGERNSMKASLTNDIKGLTTEANILKEQLRALD